MRIYFLLLFANLVACTSKNASEQQREEPVLQISIYPGAIRGIWWSPDMHQSAALQIKDSTIYYPDTFAEFKYGLNGDTLFVFRDDGISSSVIVKLTADTLIMSTLGQQEVYTRSETQKR